VAVLELNFTLHPKQLMALQTNATECLMGGGMLSGKSFLVRVAAIIHCLEIPYCQAYLFRRRHRELISTHMEGPGSFPALLAGMGDVCTLLHNEIRFRNGARIVMAHCHEPKDRFTYAGAEMTLLCIDELTTFTEEIYTFLRTRMRLGSLVVPQKYAGRLPRAILTSNPGNIGHSWVKSYFVDQGSYRIIQQPPERGGMTRQYIPATLDDLDIPAADKEAYKAKLIASGGDQARAYLSGDWEHVSGSIFGDVFLRERHVVRRFPIPADWARRKGGLWRSCDDGFQAPAAVLWWVKDPSMQRYYIVSELYKAKMLPDEMAKVILDRDMRLQIRELDGSVYDYRRQVEGPNWIDHSAFADTGTGAQPRGYRLKTLGCEFKPVEKGSGSRVTGIQALHEMLGTDLADGAPQLQIFDNCPNLIRAFASAPPSPTDAEDLDTDWPDDHLVDCARYGIPRDRKPMKHVRWGGM